MNNARFFFLIALVFLGSMMWTEYAKEQAAARAAQEAQVQASSPAAAAAGSELPGTAPVASPQMSAVAAESGEVPQAPLAVAAPEALAASSGPKVRVSTDLVSAEIDLLGGDFSHYELRRYIRGVEPKPEAAVVLFDSAPERRFRAQSGWVGGEGNPFSHERALYTASGEHFELGEAAVLEVPLSFTSPDGVTLRKIYRFERGSYAIGLRYELVNGSPIAFTGAPYRLIHRLPAVLPGGFFVSNPETFSYVGAAVYSPAERFQKLPFDEFTETPFKRSFAGGWSAMVQHHFVSAWLPPTQEEVTYATREIAAAGALPKRFAIEQVSPAQTVAPGATLIHQTTLFAGPKLQDVLPELAPGLELTVDYGMFTFLSKPLFWLLSFFHSLVANWGFAIILLTITVKLALYKLSEAQYRSMAKMRKLQPRLKAIQERHRGDRQKLAMAQMELFKSEKVNPIGGCLPLLLQFPVFIALYWVIFESVELRQAPFIGWITDLSRQDPYYVLPILNVAIMWYTQKLTPMTGMDPTQQKIFQFMPLMMGVLFAFFPAGLVLYWCMQSGLGLLQQVYIMRKFAEPAKPG